MRWWERFFKQPKSVECHLQFVCCWWRCSAEVWWCHLTVGPLRNFAPFCPDIQRDSARRGAHRTGEGSAGAVKVDHAFSDMRWPVFPQWDNVHLGTLLRSKGRCNAWRCGCCPHWTLCAASREMSSGGCRQPWATPTAPSAARHEGYAPRDLQTWWSWKS